MTNQLSEMKCRSCGATLDISAAVGGVIKCRYCLNTYAVPKTDINSSALNLLLVGEHELDNGAFDRAYAAYEKAAEESPSEPQAYFGMALARFKVQLLKDHVHNRLQPICHEISEKKFSSDKNFLRALELATKEQRALYTEQAREIDYIKDEFCKLRASGLQYDCFICVKVTDDETHARTSDYKDADDIYFELKEKGLRPFFSERELTKVTGADYEARILYALHCAECMLVVCSNENQLQTPWVKNEYTRFLKLVGDEEKESDSIAIVFNGVPIEHLPGRHGKLQGIDLSKRNSFASITEFVYNHTPLARKEREQAEQKKRREEELIKQQIEEVRRSTQKQDEERRRLEEKLINMQTGAAPSGGTSVGSLIMRAKQFLEDGEYEKAEEYFNRVLDIDPQNADAWFGLFFAEKRSAQDGLIRGLTSGSAAEITENKNFINAVRFSNGANAAVNGFTDKLKNQIENNIRESNLAITSAENRISDLKNERSIATEEKSKLGKERRNSNPQDLGDRFFVPVGLISFIAAILVAITMFLGSCSGAFFDGKFGVGVIGSALIGIAAGAVLLGLLTLIVYVPLLISAEKNQKHNDEIFYKEQAIKSINYDIGREESVIREKRDDITTYNRILSKLQ